jgi:hypothetical protein
MKLTPSESKPPTRHTSEGPAWWYGFRVSFRPLVIATLSLACGAVYPEVSTPLRTPPPGFSLKPPPPKDLFFIRFDGAVIPNKTRDGRRWDSVGGEAPDPYAKILVNGKEVILTPIESDTLTPSWPDQEAANYRILPNDKVQVELWDSNPLTNLPICTEAIRDIAELASGDQPVVEIRCDNGGRVELVIEPAHGKLGLGFDYELRTEGAMFTKVIKESPAGRAGLRPGDEIITAQETLVSKMEDGGLQSIINANAALGLRLGIRSSDGSKRNVTLRDGSVYPLFNEGVPLQ